jgi:hypothetical protein
MPKRAKSYRLTREVHDTIIRWLKAGAFRRHAAEAAGVSEDALNQWLKRGAAGERAFLELYADVRRTQAEDAIRMQAVITSAAMKHVEGDWKAAAWNLERKYPKLYGRQAEPQIGVTFEPGDEDNGSRTRVEFYIPSNGRRPDEALTEDDEGEGGS